MTLRWTSAAMFPTASEMQASTDAAIVQKSSRSGKAVTKFPEPAQDFRVPILALAAVGLVYGSLLAFRAPDVRGVIAYSSLAIGNLAALVQRNVKRMLAYSSVSHAGFMLIPIAAANELGGQALLYYLIPYGAASLGAFAIVAARERELRQPVTLDNLSGMGWERPFLGFSLALFAFAFIGLPPGGLCVGKLCAFSAAVDADMTWLVSVGVVATAVSVYYYLAIVRSLYMRTELRLVPAGGAPPRELLLTASVVVTLAIVVGSFVFVQPLLDLAGNAADSLGF